MRTASAEQSQCWCKGSPASASDSLRRAGSRLRPLRFRRTRGGSSVLQHRRRRTALSAPAVALSKLTDVARRSPWRSSRARTRSTRCTLLSYTSCTSARRLVKDSSGRSKRTCSACSRGIAVWEAAGFRPRSAGVPSKPCAGALGWTVNALRPRSTAAMSGSARPFQTQTLRSGRLGPSLPLPRSKERSRRIPLSWRARPWQWHSTCANASSTARRRPKSYCLRSLFPSSFGRP
mmetsp:Transcript_14097/g.45149  ORF Transcript_14097/g.45149 Transcript_14097/m.45149 type:complete len:234 (-) Transcript_14097:1769-2470(-)